MQDFCHSSQPWYRKKSTIPRATPLRTIYLEKPAALSFATTSEPEGKPWPPSLLQYTVPSSPVTSKAELLGDPWALPRTSTEGNSWLEKCELVGIGQGMLGGRTFSTACATERNFEPYPQDVLRVRSAKSQTNSGCGSVVQRTSIRCKFSPWL